MAPHTKWAELARWGLPALLVAAALALVAAAWSIVNGVGAASATLVRGQAEELGARIAFELRDPDGAASAEDLLAIMGEEGLTYVAFFDDDDRPVEEAGEPSGPRSGIERSYRDGRFREIEEVSEDRVRVIRRRPRRARRWRNPDERRASPLLRTRRPGVAFEFEPQPAIDLRRRSNQVLATGAIGATLLLAAAVALGSWLIRREKRLDQLDRERRLAQLGEMSAVLAHEIRNPLASLKGNAQLLERMAASDAKLHARAERVVGEAVRLEQLTTDLLEFARSGSIERTPCDLTALVREIAEASAAQVVVESPDAAIEVPIDRERIRQVLTNLVANAAEASPAPVTVRVEASPAQVVIDVEDRGPGIEPAALPHLFEAFFTTKTHGTGLGLAVARRLVELHDGTLSADNRDGGGARFRMTLPRRSA